MTDSFSKADRSGIMKKIKSKGNNSTEQALIKIFRKNNIKGWKRGYPVIGKPDFVFSKLRIAVFTDGCFWHGHDCRNTVPKQNSEYWDKKRKRNFNRDKKINQIFQNRDWTVLRFWECDIKNGKVDLSPLLPE
jgi:DNA mismatch endonuclease (patch repair protein)